MKFSKAIDLEDFQSQELWPYLEVIAENEMASFGNKKPVIIPDSKNWETAMALYSFERHGLFQEGKLFAGIGAGTERLTEMLANKGAITFPVDRYLETTPWSDVAPSGYMVGVSQYSSKGTESRNIIPVHSDARKLDLPSNFFDGIYSSGSIEHFGGLEAVEAAAYEIARILKPGGIASISTEFRLDGPAGIPWFDDNCILFTPEIILKHIIEPSGLIAVEMPDNQPSSETYKTRKHLVNFLNSAKNARTFQDKLDAYPNLVLFHEGFLFCSVHILLQKPPNWKPIPKSISKVDRFQEEIQANYRRSIDILKRAFAYDDCPKTERETRFVFKILGSVMSKLKKSPKLKYCVMRILHKFPRICAFLRKKLKTYETETAA